MELIGQAPWWESQIIGVLVGVLIAGAISVAMELRRGRSERRSEARNLRQATHAELLRAAYDLREAMVRVFVTSAPPLKGLTKADLADVESERRKALDWYDTSGRKFGELLNVIYAFGSHDVYAAARSMAGYVQTGVQEFFDGKDPEDIDHQVDWFITYMAVHAREDADAGVGVPPYEPGEAPTVPQYHGEPVAAPEGTAKPDSA